MGLFTHTTIVNPLVSIRRKRLLPKAGEVIIGVGQNVSPMHVLARTPLTSQYFVLPITGMLGVEAEAVAERLLVPVGETVNQETVLAESKRLFGSKPILSPVSGTIEVIDNGRLIIKQSTDWLELRAMVQGRVISYETNLGVTLEIVGAHIQGVWATGDITIGDLHIAVEGPSKPLAAENIPDRLNNVILVVGHIDEPDLITNLADSNLRGIIAGSMSHNLCEIANTVGLSILVTDGIGQYPMAEPIFQLLQAHADNEASLFTEYNMLVGERPEIIIPHSGIPKIETPPYNKPLARGQTVRLLGSPYHGQIGTVMHLLSSKHNMFAGINGHGAVIMLKNGSKVFIPSSNLDVFI